MEIDLRRDESIMSIDERNGLERVFIKAVCAESGNERDLDLECIKRFDNIRGKMRLLFNDGAERNFYFVPELSYKEARQKIEKLKGLRFIDLAKL